MQTGLHLEGAVALAQRILPFFDINLGWVVPAAIGLALGLFLRARRKG